jgi:hypothetical protein
MFPAISIHRRKNQRKVATKKNENLEKYRGRYQQIKEKILGLGYVCIGNVQTRYLKCGKDTCSCHQSAEFRHGPYHYWVRRVKGRTISVLLKDEDEVKLCRAWIDDNRILEPSVSEMRKLPAQVLAIQTRKKRQ